MIVLGIYVCFDIDYRPPTNKIAGRQCFRVCLSVSHLSTGWKGFRVTNYPWFIGFNCYMCISQPVYGFNPKVYWIKTLTIVWLQVLSLLWNLSLWSVVEKSNAHCLYSWWQPASPARADKPYSQSHATTEAALGPLLNMGPHGTVQGSTGSDISVADPEFPRGGGANSPGGSANTNFPQNCMKLKEFGPPGGRPSLGPPLDPPLHLVARLETCSNLFTWGHDCTATGGYWSIYG